MDAVLEDIVHMAVFKPVADAAGVALGGALAAIGDADLVEVAHQIAVAARQRAAAVGRSYRAVSDRCGVDLITPAEIRTATRDAVKAAVGEYEEVPVI